MASRAYILSLPERVIEPQDLHAAPCNGCPSSLGGLKGRLEGDGVVRDHHRQMRRRAAGVALDVGERLLGYAEERELAVAVESSERLGQIQGHFDAAAVVESRGQPAQRAAETQLIGQSSTAPPPGIPEFGNYGLAPVVSRPPP